ncbi:oxidoreductase [Microtetraspora sp. NBRC 13810]|uniref:oxidoreductase n=1 Tax=Microtetraspora sp. NBRC 13810 TaxID=3030990 RepID=UPI0025531F1A|nr:oxidoreductase [Microtetraspora sp. NBRC 13810]GLW08949.1 oxidoreductase [Microtetraspora sp. NBRC 13810]
MSDPLAVIAELPGVPEAVKEAREAVDTLYRHRVLRRRSPEVSAESALRGARASAALEGVEVALGSLRAGESDDPLVQGALRVSAELGRLGPTWRTAPRQVLARLHTLAAADLTPYLGRPRTTLPTSPPPSAPPASAVSDQNAPERGGLESAGEAPRGMDPLGLGEAPGATDPFGLREVPRGTDPLGLGEAPGPEEMAIRMDGLIGLLMGKTAAPAVVLAAVVHAELAVLRPFGTADGLVARAAERLTLVEFGLDPKSLVAVEAGHHELPYADSLHAYLTGTPTGVAQWLRHCATAVTLGVREITAVCEALQRG